MEISENSLYNRQNSAHNHSYIPAAPKLYDRFRFRHFTENEEPAQSLPPAGIKFQTWINSTDVL